MRSGRYSASQRVVCGPPVGRGRLLVVREVTRHKSHFKILNFSISVFLEQPRFKELSLLYIS